MQEAFPKVTGADFRALRIHLGVDQAAIARVLGVTPTTVYRWETDRVKVTPLMYARYEAACRALLARASEVSE